jgi:hypothetical protein
MPSRCMRWLTIFSSASTNCRASVPDAAQSRRFIETPYNFLHQHQIRIDLFCQLRLKSSMQAQ